MSNPKINDFVATVEAVNDSEITVAEMHDNYANTAGYWDDDTLGRLEYFAERIQELVAMGKERRSWQ
jgi:hypothetical protein